MSPIQLEVLAPGDPRAVAVLRVHGRHSCGGLLFGDDGIAEIKRVYVERVGFAEVPAFNAGAYAEHWYAKRI